MFFRNIPLSDWIEHEILLGDEADVNRLVRDMTIFDHDGSQHCRPPTAEESPGLTLA